MAKPVHITIDPRDRTPLLNAQKSTTEAPLNVPVKQVHTHPRHPTTATTSTTSTTSPSATADISRGDTQDPQSSEGSIYFIGTATTIINFHSLRILTDPNFLHAGDHVHLGPGVTATRQTDPAVDLHDLPPIDVVLLSHYHEDHFDRKVEAALRRDVRILTTPHAKECLENGSKIEGEGAFEKVVGLDTWDSAFLHIAGNDSGEADQTVERGIVKRKGKPVVKITGMPGKHVPPGPLSVANDLLGAVPPTNGWLLELGYEDNMTTATSSLCAPIEPGSADVKTGYRIYISGDTLLVDDLKQIPQHFDNQKLDLMLVHLGGTTIPGPAMPLLMVTMDAEQGFRLMQLMDPDVTIPIHFDDYDVFMSPLEDFKGKVEGEGWGDRVVYLDRGEMYKFDVRQ